MPSAESISFALAPPAEAATRLRVPALPFWCYDAYRSLAKGIPVSCTVRAGRLAFHFPLEGLTLQLTWGGFSAACEGNCRCVGDDGFRCTCWQSDMVGLEGWLPRCASRGSGGGGRLSGGRGQEEISNMGEMMSHLLSRRSPEQGPMDCAL